MVKRSNSAWTQDEEDYLINNYKELTVKEIAENIKRSRDSVSTRASMLGLSRRIIIREYHDRIVRLLENNEGNADIARKIGVSSSALWRYLKENDLDCIRRKPLSFSKLAIANGIEDPITFSLSNMSLKQWYNYWYQSYRRSTIREVTKAKYRQSYGAVCTQPIADMLIKNINRGHAQEYINWYGERRSKQTVLDHYQFLKSCFDDAMQDGYVDRNPFANVKMVFMEQTLSPKELKVKREKKKSLELEEYTKLRYHLTFWFDINLKVNPIRNNNSLSKGMALPLQISYMIIFVALKTGARFSEIIGLTQDDIDDVNRTINIDKTWDYKTDTGFIHTKNTASIRTVEVDSETMDAITKYKKWLIDFNVTTKDDTLFIETGGAMHNSSINAHLGKLLEGLGIEQLTIHKLRHTHASILIANGVPIMVVAKRLGHSSPNMLERVYGHLLATTEDEGNRMIMRLI